MSAIHFIGVGGIGMSGLVSILLDQGYSFLSGSDLNPHDSYTIEALQKRGLIVYEGHDPSYIASEITCVVVSSDIGENNVELLEAKKRNLPILHRSDILAEILNPFRSLIVTGTHGKTTTSALLSHVCTDFGRTKGDFLSSFIVGGVVKNYNTNAHYVKNSLYFVAEGDESDGTFLKYKPYGAIITNIDSDHLAYYGSMNALENGFRSFANRVEEAQKYLFISGDCPRSSKLIHSGIKYGFNPENDVRITNLIEGDSGIEFDLIMKNGVEYKSIFLPLYGRHNAMNGAAVFALSIQIGISENCIRDSFSSFLGVARRLDKQYEGAKNGIVVFDDYAHHPTEVRATLQAVRNAFPLRRIIAVFQPHRPSRIKYILEEFSKAYRDADSIFLTDLYNASEEKSENQALLTRLKEIITLSHIGTPLSFITDQNELLSTIFPTLRPYDVVLFMGAGSIGKSAKELANMLKEFDPVKYSVSIVYGGKNSENRISQASAQAIWNNINSDLFDKNAFYIDIEGVWRKTDGICLCKEEQKPSERRAIDPNVFEQLISTDILFPILHGPYGEDGTIQGFCEILGIPYVGSDHTASALAMDKSHAKSIVQAAGIPVLPFISLQKNEWDQNPDILLEKIDAAGLSFPLFMKPAHLGSSIGIQKIEQMELLVSAIEKGFELDSKLIIEEALISFREIEFTPLGNKNISIPHPGEVLGDGQIYDYKAKYGPQSFATTASADLDPLLIREGQEYARRVYEALGLSGLCRIDFFLQNGKKWYFNEANPMPGFTEKSLYPTVWKRNGVIFSELITSLLLLGLQKSREKDGVAKRSVYEGKRLESLCVL